MSTLPPTPSYDPNVPIVSPAGGTSSAYKDPNSAESIMRKTAQLNVQSIVDSKYDVKENFSGCSIVSQISSIGLLLLLVISLLLFTVLTRSAKGFLLSLAFVLLVLLLVLQKKNV